MELRTDPERLYRENSRTLTAVAMRYIHDKEVAEDIVHDSWIIIFTNLGSLKSEDKILLWMKGIVRNLSLKYLAAQKRHPSTSIDDGHEDVPEDDSEPMLPPVPFDELMSMIDSLPEKYGEVFRLSVLSGMTHQEIGDLLGIAPHSSSSDLSRARKLLLQKVRKYLLMTLALLLPVSALILHYRKPVAGEESIADSRSMVPEGTVLPEFESMVPEGTVVPEFKSVVPESRGMAPEERPADPERNPLPKIGKPEPIRSAAASLPGSVRDGLQQRTASAILPSDGRESAGTIFRFRHPAGKYLSGSWTAILGLSGVSGLSSLTTANTITLANYSPLVNIAGTSAFDTYYTTHPLMISTPVGLRWEF